MGTQLTAHADANSEARMLRSLPRRNLLAYFPVAGATGCKKFAPPALFACYNIF